MSDIENLVQKQYKAGYQQGRKDAFTQIILYLNDASLSHSGECYKCTRQLIEIIERMETGTKNNGEE